MKSRAKLIPILLGPILFFACAFGLSGLSVFSSKAACAAVGTVLWMALWWITGAVDFAVTAFLPIAINALFQITDMSAVIANYASETILLLLGASILTASWEETGLDRRIAATFFRIMYIPSFYFYFFYFIFCTLL